MASSAAAVVVPEGAEFITVAQAAHMVQVCDATIRDWCRQGKLRRYGEGRVWRVRRAELLAYLEGGNPRPKPVSIESRAADILRGVRR